MAASDTYVCTLSEKSLKKAKKELHEDPKERLSAVQTFRDWIEQQPHITCLTETRILMRFLRAAKFSQLRAREQLENYLRAMTDNQDWFRNIDLGSPEMRAFLKTGYFNFAGIDSEGQTVMIMSPEKMDVHSKEYKKEDVMRGLIGSFYALFFDEEHQVNGGVFVFDASGYSLKHQTYFGLDDMRRSTKIWQKSFPARYKGFHYYNIGPVFEGMMKIMQPLLSKKWKERIHIHSTMESVYKYVPKEHLPVEYLPDDYKGPNVGTLKQLTEKTCAFMAQPDVIERVLYLTNPDKFRIDTTQKIAGMPNESFRKLNID